MKSIKVYLQYPWRFPGGTYYKNLLEYTPEGTEYTKTAKNQEVITNKRLLWILTHSKRIVRKFLRKLDISVLNAHLSPQGDYDLIHCAHCLSKNKDKPWVADVETVRQFWIAMQVPKNKQEVKDILSRKNCKKILPWTQAGANEIIKEFPGIKDKVEVVYPAVSASKIKKKKHKEINLLFVGRYFYNKGGFHALEVMDNLTKRYENVRGIVVSEVPQEIKIRYSKNDKIKFYELMPQEKLFREIFSISDIFIYPGYTDTFGFSLIEVMSEGIPVVTVDKDERKEIVEEGRTGFIVDSDLQIDPLKFSKIEKGPLKEKILKEMTEKTSKLIEDKRLREKMSKNCINEIKNGKFSIKERNKKLRKIYEEALI